MGVDTAEEKCYLPDLNTEFLIRKKLNNILFRVFGLSCFRDEIFKLIQGKI